MCQHTTIDLLKKGFWKKYVDCKDGEEKINPFTEVPWYVVGHLVKYTFSFPLRKSLLPNHKYLYLLLSSHPLQRLDLSSFKRFKNDFDPAPNNLSQNLICTLIQYMSGSDESQAMQELSLLLYKLSENDCPDLRSIIIPSYIELCSRAVESLIRVSPNLEDFHARSVLNIEIFQHCQNLRSLMLHGDRTIYSIEDNLSSIQNVEYLEFCDVDYVCYRRHEIIAKILNNLPNLVSLGKLDTSMALNYIKAQENHITNFKLQRCFWGINEDSLARAHVQPIVYHRYKSDSTNIIKNAASLCPSVEVLAIQVFQKDCLQYLCLLKQLRFLRLDFTVCVDTYLDAFLSLINDIGKQLKHLSVSDRGSDEIQPPSVVRFPIDIICKNSINLESLQLKGLSTINNPLEVRTSLCNLKRLFIENINSYDFMLILQNCFNLTELFIKNLPILDSSELEKIFYKSSLLNLRKLCIFTSELSEAAMKTVLAKAVNLEKVYFDKSQYSASLLEVMNHGAVFDSELLQSEFLNPGLSNCRF
ncbi:uncharacterized protein CDAR_217021 [Caerostris darwini]|uniref:Uncharacterized protein n=1 Tax=Caerostris darwini TaxID=1538125 RepID=A0AAV4UTR0_9ARAC|nr:uncharacterized protein CDAR_217021 [Caerostris darwini]